MPDTLQPARSVYRLRIPVFPYDPQTRREWCFGLLAVWAIAALFLWSAANVLGVPPEWNIDAFRPRDDRCFWNSHVARKAVPSLLLLAAVAPLAWGLSLRRTPPPRSKRARIRLRRARLASVTRHSQAGQRVPHRIVEHDYYSRQPRILKRDLRHLLTTLPPGFIVLVSPEGTRRDLEIAALPHVFEPVELDDDAGCSALLHSQLPDASRTHAASRRAVSPASAKSRLQLVRSRLAHLLEWSTLALVVALPVGMAFISRSRPCIALVGACALFLLVCRATGGSARRPIYLLPGAFVIVNDHSGRRLSEITIFRRKTSTMIVYTDAKQNETRGIIQQRHEACTLRMHSAALSAWLSTARSPTDEEIASLLG